MSAAYRWTGDDLGQIEALARSLPPAIIRAKGFLSSKGDNYLFSYVLGDWSLQKSDIPSDRIQHKNLIVFIGPPEAVALLEGEEATGNWSKLSTYQPLA